MSADDRIEGFFDYVVPPLERFWWQAGIDGIDYSDKSTVCRMSVIRLPNFITKKDFSETRIHHEIYLSDAGKVVPEKWKTVIRQPIQKR